MNTTIIVVWLALCVGLFAVTMLKGKFWMGIISILIGGPFVTIFGVSRLAKPDSWWAQRFYAPPPVAEMFR
jgi:hypothetical protein